MQAYRSVEIQLTNNTSGALIVTGLTIGAGNSWIANEVPREGGTVGQYESATWGVSSDDPTAAVSGQIQLGIAGTKRIVLNFSNTADGSSQCTADATDSVQAIVQQNETGEANHAMFAVQLIP